VKKKPIMILSDMDDNRQFKFKLRGQTPNASKDKFNAVKQ
jgi:hypothetical protein